MAFPGLAHRVQPFNCERSVSGWTISLLPAKFLTCNPFRFNDLSNKVDCVVVGAGVVGLAIARKFALAGHNVVVLEQESEVASHASSRNSEVIHAGIYYPTKSLKASLCVRGRQMLYEYCNNHHVPCSKIGKLIVAADVAEQEILDRYEAQSIANGVTDIVRLDKAQVASLEPAVSCAGGLLSPSTGIIDSHSYVLALIADIEANGGSIVCRSRVTRICQKEGGLHVTIGTNPDHSIRCKTLVNSAGFWAQDVARTVQDIDKESIPALHLAKAHYFTLQGISPFKRLIYPVASKGGLGIHLTLDMAGQARFGPDVTWVDTIDYSFDESRRTDFVEAIRKYYPHLDETRLRAGYTGIRPKLTETGELTADFAVQLADEHNIAGLINLYGIESPGLTASLALADYVFDLQKTI